ncbi:MAG: hypothetical protein LC541_18270 [Candidatus Thiodiazotropha sp.]|nr:hypothetical protein [Candidatus Thiodiazotropha sp.]MCM8921004.1 hypothetical protein [Candidatus Thiodiazotropha sp.]
MNGKKYPDWMPDNKNVRFSYDHAKKNGIKVTPISDKNLEEIKAVTKELLSWDYYYDRKRFKTIRDRNLSNNPSLRKRLERKLPKELGNYGGAYQLVKGVEETLSFSLADVRILFEKHEAVSDTDLYTYDMIADNLLKHVNALISTSVEAANNAYIKLAEKNRIQTRDKLSNKDKAKKLLPEYLKKHEGNRNYKNLAYSEIAEVLGVSVRTVQRYLNK